MASNTAFAAMQSLADKFELGMKIESAEDLAEFGKWVAKASTYDSKYVKTRL